MANQFSQVGQSDQSLTFKIMAPTELLTFLLEALTNRSRNSIKSILSRGQVQVDGKVVTKFNYPLQSGQMVEILKNEAAKRKSALMGVKLLYEDQDVIVIEKDAGLLSIATEKEKELTAYSQITDYVKQAHSKNRVFVVHRLDRDTSGVMMFARSEHVKEKLQTNWKEMVKERTYVALVEGHVENEKGKITSWLRESKTHIVYSSFKKDDGQYAITHYKRVQSNEDFSLLEVNLDTGRKNQIRVHMKDLGHPIVGDKKYGSTKNTIGRLGLHAKVLTFIHPKTNQTMRFEAKAPKVFYNKSRK